MLEVGAVVRAGREHDDDRVGHPVRCDAGKVAEEAVRVVLDGRDAVECEQLRKEPHHHLAVLEHVGHAGGHAQVVLENVELAWPGPDDVDAGDVRVDAARDVHVLHLGPVLRVAVDLFRRNHRRTQDVLLVVDVADEGVQGPHALPQARRQRPPFLAESTRGTMSNGISRSLPSCSP